MDRAPETKAELLGLSVLEDWELRAKRLRESLNFKEEFSRSGRQYSELDAQGNVVVINATE